MIKKQTEKEPCNGILQEFTQQTTKVARETNNVKSNDFISRKELLHLLNVGSTTLYNLQKQGIVKVYKVAKGKNAKSYYKRSEVDKLFNPVNSTSCK